MQNTQKITRLLHLLQNKSFFHLLSANLLTQFLGFGTVVFIAKLISPTEIGQIKILQSYIALFVILAGFGFNTSVLKYCAENISQEQRWGIFNYSVKCSLVTTLCGYLLWFLFDSYKIILSTSQIGSWILIYGLLLPFSVMTNLGMIYLQAVKQVRKMAKAQSIIKLQSFLIIVGSTYFWGIKGFIASTVFAYFIGMIPVFREIGFSFIFYKSFVPRSFLSIAVFSMLGNIVSLIGQYGDIFILDHFCPDKEQIGFYSLASIFLIGAMQVTGTVQSIVAPYFSEHNRDKRWVYSQLIKNQLRMVVLAILVALGIYIFCYYFIPFFYGYNYIITFLYLKILLLKYIVYSSYAVTGVCLVGLGLIKYNIGVVFISTPIGLFLSYLLLQNYGVIGVAYAQFFTAIFIFILQIAVTKFALSKYFRFLK
ncbi:hypothetical protein SPACI_042600 [Sporomusa acidovorans DSM 3132]|uniref:Polysaccharide biosynthesis protein n=2 Tax=Sporomusa TaxID=2375 RepID=A0ABZ3J7Q7_SPOA4|nr:oligosaccharide flippase family protein [Sporomusa acidovorans]OZC19344.1 polysaccharide biosynthesis protein [Sporomusa acidovorans DSM 3132]SDD80093.1 Membrane protein involved in the export of O-antigen and teichoic acid [Sporomusa acidovorans]